MVSIPYSSVVNGWKTLPLRGPAATSAPANFPQIHGFQGIAMARQFVYFMQGLSKPIRPTARCSITSHLSFYPDAKIGVLGVTALVNRPCCGSWPASPRSIPARPGSPTGARVGYLEQEPQLDPTKTAARKRHAGRRQAEGDPRSLQRARRQLFRRDRGRDDQAAGRDRSAGLVGSRQQGRSGDGMRCVARRTMRM